MEYEEYLEQGETLAGEGLIEEALGRFERALAAAPENPEAYVELGRYYGFMGEPALAKATFERWTNRVPEDADMLINAGLTLFDAADYVEALEFFEKAIEAAAEEVQKCGARTFRANALDMLGRYAEAVALGRDEIRHLITLGEARLALGDEVGAAEAYGAVLALDPENPEAHLELGIINERKGEMERAEEHFVESLKIDPANPRALYSYASLYYTADDLEAEEEILERAIAADARYSPALSALASIQARRGEYGDALDYIEKAVDAGESDVEHFRSALEFAPLHADPRFRTLLSRMVGDRSNGQG